jgi:hypothetical protein
MTKFLKWYGTMDFPSEKENEFARLLNPGVTVSQDRMNQLRHLHYKSDLNNVSGARRAQAIVVPGCQSLRAFREDIISDFFDDKGKPLNSPLQPSRDSGEDCDTEERKDRLKEKLNQVCLNLLGVLKDIEVSGDYLGHVLSPDSIFCDEKGRLACPDLELSPPAAMPEWCKSREFLELGGQFIPFTQDSSEKLCSDSINQAIERYYSKPEELASEEWAAYRRDFDRKIILRLVYWLLTGSTVVDSKAWPNRFNTDVLSELQKGFNSKIEDFSITELIEDVDRCCPSSIFDPDPNSGREKRPTPGSLVKFILLPCLLLASVAGTAVYLPTVIDQLFPQPPVFPFELCPQCSSESALNNYLTEQEKDWKAFVQGYSGLADLSDPIPEQQLPGQVAEWFKIRGNQDRRKATDPDSVSSDLIQKQMAILERQINRFLECSASYSAQENQKDGNSEEAKCLDKEFNRLMDHSRLQFYMIVSYYNSDANPPASYVKGLAKNLHDQCVRLLEYGRATGSPRAEKWYQEMSDFFEIFGLS